LKKPGWLRAVPIFQCGPSVPKEASRRHESRFGMVFILYNSCFVPFCLVPCMLRTACPSVSTIDRNSNSELFVAVRLLSACFRFLLYQKSLSIPLYLFSLSIELLWLFVSCVRACVLPCVQKKRNKKTPALLADFAD